MADKTYKLTFELSDGTEKTVNFTAPQGPAGAAGTNGTNGTNGKDGADGVGITNITIAEV